MKMFVIYNVKCVNTPEAKKLKQISPEDPKDPKDPHSQGVLVTSHSIYTKNHVSSIIKKSQLTIFVITVNITIHVIPL